MIFYDPHFYTISKREVRMLSSETNGNRLPTFTLQIEPGHEVGSLVKSATTPRSSLVLKLNFICKAG